MIPRYSRTPMTEIWSSKSKFQIWLDIELYACEAMEKLGTVPKGTARKVRSKAKINEKRIDQIEKKVKHDVIAFLTSITEGPRVPDKTGKSRAKPNLSSDNLKLLSDNFFYLFDDHYRWSHRILKFEITKII